MNTKTQNTFMSFIVGGSSDNATVFRVVDIVKEIVGETVSIEAVEQLLTQLPIQFSLRKDASIYSEALNEPLEVYIAGTIISIYPPPNRIITCTIVKSVKNDERVKYLGLDNVMDLTFPGDPQVRTCLHFSPTLFGINNWCADKGIGEVEVDIHVYPRGKDNEIKIKEPHIDLRKLLDLIAGGEQPLSKLQYREWHDLIKYAIAKMKACYENDQVEADYPVRVYYKPYWDELAEAITELDYMVALERLRDAIRKK